jgi:hypothetical protein
LQIPFSLDFDASDAVRLVPVQLRKPHSAIAEPNPSHAFHFPPSSTPVQLRKPFKGSNASRDSHRFDDLDRRKDFKLIRHGRVPGGEQ